MGQIAIICLKYKLKSFFQYMLLRFRPGVIKTYEWFIGSAFTLNLLMIHLNLPILFPLDDNKLFLLTKLSLNPER